MGLTRQASRLPLTALSLGLQAWERSAGLRHFALRRGNEALQIAAHTPFGRLLPKLILDDGADEEGARIAADARAESPAPPRTPPRTQKRTPKQEPEPKPTPTTGATSAVTPEVEQIVEKIVDQLEITEPDNRDELPIPDFDNITLGSLRSRLRNLSVEQLVALREWEQAHAHRVPVMTALDNRIAKLSEAEAYPGTPGPPAPARPS